MVKLTIKIEARDLYDYLLRHSYNSPAGILGSVIAAGMVIVSLSKQYWAGLVLGVVLLFYLPFTLFIRSRKQILRNPSFQEPLQYVLDDRGMTISQGEEEANIAWEDMYKAVSTSKSIILYTSQVNAAIFPKRELGDQKAALIEMISTHMSPAKVKIRG